MLTNFLLLSETTFIFFIYVFIIKKDYKRVTFLYSFSLITIFYTPSLYFFFGGETYRFFSDKSLIEFFQVGTFTILIYLICSLIIDLFRLKRKYLYVKDNIFVKIYFLVFLIPIILYYSIYFKHFPLVYLFISGKLIGRPDLTGAIPHFYTVSLIVAIIIPSAYFFYFRQIKSNFLHLAINIILTFLFVASGNKGFFVYYLIFIWLYIFRARVNFILFIFFILSMLIYLITKGITSFNVKILYYLANSPFRRFFVTQGTGFIHRIDMLNKGFDFLHNANPRGLKFDVFQHMYNTNIIGSAPTFYTGNLFVLYGPWFSMLVFVVVSFILLYLSKYLNNMVTNKKLFIYWNIYSLMYFIVMSGIDFANFIRMMLPIVNIFVVIFLSKIKIKNERAYGKISINNNSFV